MEYKVLSMSIYISIVNHEKEFEHKIDVNDINDVIKNNVMVENIE